MNLEQAKAYLKARNIGAIDVTSKFSYRPAVKTDVRATIKRELKRLASERDETDNLIEFKRERP